jgi:hypothetical protein
MEVPRETRIRIEALEDTVTQQMRQLREQGDKLMELELKEQKILGDLRNRCQKVWRWLRCLTFTCSARRLLPMYRSGSFLSDIGAARAVFAPRRDTCVGDACGAGR